VIEKADQRLRGRDHLTTPAVLSESAALEPTARFPRGTSVHTEPKTLTEDGYEAPRAMGAETANLKKVSPALSRRKTSEVRAAGCESVRPDGVQLSPVWCSLRNPGRRAAHGIVAGGDHMAFCRSIYALAKTHVGRASLARGTPAPTEHHIPVLCSALGLPILSCGSGSGLPLRACAHSIT